MRQLMHCDAKFSGSTVPEQKQCHGCAKPSKRYRCEDCQRAYNTAQSKAWREKGGKDQRTGPAPEPPMKPLSQCDPLVLLILAGWGDVAQPKIPRDVRKAAETSRMPRKHPWKRESMRPKVVMRPRIAMQEASV